MYRRKKKKNREKTKPHAPDSDMDGDEDVLHADEVVDAPDAVV